MVEIGFPCSILQDGQIYTLGGAWPEQQRMDAEGALGLCNQAIFDDQLRVRWGCGAGAVSGAGVQVCESQPIGYKQPGMRTSWGKSVKSHLGGAGCALPRFFVTNDT